MRQQPSQSQAAFPSLVSTALVAAYWALSNPACWYSEIEQLSNGHLQPPRCLLQHFETRGIDPPLNQAQEINADSHQFRELLLRQLAFFANGFQPTSELLPKGEHSRG
jgi:hypothetical protein